MRDYFTRGRGEKGCGPLGTRGKGVICRRKDGAVGEGQNLQGLCRKESLGLQRGEWIGGSKSGGLRGTRRLMDKCRANVDYMSLNEWMLRNESRGLQAIHATVLMITIHQN